MRHGESYGQSVTKEYRAWRGMKNRCLNQNAPNYSRYGGLGVGVCRQWVESYKRFLEDVGRAPSPKHSLDRFPDKRGNYEPGNVRWATIAEQQNNLRSNRIIEFRGRHQTLAQWADETGIDNVTIHHRLKRGWSIEQALTLPAYASILDPEKRRNNTRSALKARWSRPRTAEQHAAISEHAKRAGAVGAAKRWGRS